MLRVFRFSLLIGAALLAPPLSAPSAALAAKGYDKLDEMLETL